MKEITELVNDSCKPLVKEPQIPEFWRHGGNKGTSLCLQLLQKNRTRAQCHRKLFPPPGNHDKTILFQLNKSSPQSTPALPGNPSSTKGFCQLQHWLPTGALATWNCKQSYRRAVLLSDKKTSPGASLQGRTILPTLEYFNSNLYTFRNVYTPVTKRVILTSSTLHKLLPLS